MNNGSRKAILAAIRASNPAATVIDLGPDVHRTVHPELVTQTQLTPPVTHR